MNDCVDYVFFSRLCQEMFCLTLALSFLSRNL